LGVQFIEAERAETPGLALESWQVGRPVPEPNEVGVEEDRVRIEGAVEGLGGVEVVSGGVGRRELLLSATVVDHP